MIIKTPFSLKKNLLALGAESAGNFSLFEKGRICFSEDFGDLLEEKIFKKFKKAVLKCLKNKKIKPEIILTDLHPFYKTTVWGKELAKKFKAKHIQVQHHLAHIFSAIGEKAIIEDCCARTRDKLKIENCVGIACDGTGYGLDKKIWGGEVFNVKYQMSNVKCVERIGHLENQILIGGDLAIREPARMLISILDKFSIFNFPRRTPFFFRKDRGLRGKPRRSRFATLRGRQFSNTKKDFIYQFVKKYYTRNQFEVLYNQLQQNFNCQETSSAGRVLDAVSVLLGFCKNQRNYKHEPIDLLEKNSTIPYQNIQPKIKKIENYILLTTPLFEYLIKNLDRDKKRLAAASQLYLTKGLYQICQMSNVKCQMYFSGGIANNKIFSSYLESKGAITNKKNPRGDAGISFGQLIYYLFLKENQN